MSASEPLQPTVITDLAYRVFPSFALLAGMELKLFSRLSPEGATLAELASRLRTDAGKLQPLVDLLVASELLVRSADRLTNSPEAEHFLVEGKPDYRGALAPFYERLWRVALKTSESIRSGAPAAKVDFAGFDTEQGMAFFRRQYPSSLIAGQELAQHVDFRQYRELADVGGGTGGTSIGLCTAWPHLCSTVYELASVMPIADTFIAEAGMSSRIRVGAIEGADDMSGGEHDLALLRSVLQVLDPDSAGAVVRRAYALLRPGGDLVIVGSVLEDSRRGPAPALARGLIFVNVYDSGQSYTESQHRLWLSDAGFEDVRVDYGCMRDGTSIVRARRPQTR